MTTPSAGTGDAGYVANVFQKEVNYLKTKPSVSVDITGRGEGRLLA